MKHIWRGLFKAAIAGLKALRHHPEYQLDDGIIGPVWLTRDELIAEQDRWRSELVLRCVDDYLHGEHFSLDLLRDKA